jgi:hypothetical protein
MGVRPLAWIPPNESVIGDWWLADHGSVENLATRRLRIATRKAVEYLRQKGLKVYSSSSAAACQQEKKPAASRQP